MTAVDLSYDELVLLIGLINGRFVEIARRDPEATTAFEEALFEKLYAHMDEMNIVKGAAGNAPGTPA